MGISRIFISYAHRNQRLARALHEALQEAGFHSVMNTLRDHQPWPAENAYMVMEYDVICLLWTPEAAISPWMRHEWQTARALGKRVIPCVFPHAPKIPTPISRVFAIEFKDISRSCEVLIDHLKYASPFTAQYQLDELPDKSLMPFRMPTDFISRDLDMVEIYLHLNDLYNKVVLVNEDDTQVDGFGKTTLAAAFAHRFGIAFEKIFWLQADSEARWLSEWISLARDHLALTVANPEAADANRQYLQKLQTYCNNHPNILIVADNVFGREIFENDEYLLGLNPMSLKCNILFTSRFPVSDLGLISHPVKRFSMITSYFYLAGQEASGKSRKFINDICHRVGYLPLRLSLLKGYLHHKKAMPVAEYYADICKIAEENSDDAGLSVAVQEKVMDFTLEKIWALLANSLAGELLSLCAALPADYPITIARLKLLYRQDSDNKVEMPGFKQALQQLRLLNLLDFAPKEQALIRIPDLVRAFILNKIGTAQDEIIRAAVKTLSEVCRKPLVLTDQLLNRPLWAFVEDIDAALSWELSDAKIRKELKQIRRLLLRTRSEISELRTWGKRSYLLQQLFWSAVQMGMVTFGEKVRQTIFREEEMFFENRFLTRFEDPCLLKTLNGHSAPINTVALSADSDWVASGSNDKKILLWHLWKKNASYVFDGHNGAVKALSFLGDSHLISAGNDGRILCWDIAAGQLEQEYEGHDGGVNAIDCSKDGRWLLSGGEDHQLVLRKMPSGEIIHTFSDHAMPLTAVAINDDGSIGISGSEDGTIFIWDFLTGKMCHALPVQSGWVLSLSLLDNGQFALSATIGSGTQFWSVSAGERLFALEGQSAAIKSAAVATDSRFALAGADDGSLKLWELGGGKIVRSLKGHRHAVHSVKINDSGDIAISGAMDRTVRVWDLSNGDLRTDRQQHHSRISHLALSGDGRTVASQSCKEKMLIFREFANGAIKNIIRPDEQPTAITLNNDGTLAFCGYSSGHFSVLERKNGTVAARYEGHHSAINAIALNEGRQLALTGGDDGKMLLWELPSGIVRRLIVRPNTWIEQVSLSSDGQRGMCILGSGRIEIWDLVNDHLLGECESSSIFHHQGHLLADGRRFLFANAPNTWALKDLDNGDIIHELKGHQAEILGSSLAGNGKFLLSYDDHGKLIIWDIKQGTIVQQFYTFKRCSAIAASENNIALGNNSGTVAFWEFYSGEE